MAVTSTLAGLLWLLLPFFIRGGARRRIYTVLVIAGLFQTGLACWQTLLPVSAAHYLGYEFLRTGGRATGGFGQANLLGSFLATSLLCALWLLLSSPERQGRGCAAAAVPLLFIGLILSESRSAWIGITVGTLLLLVVAPFFRQRLQILLLIAAGLAAGLAVSHFRPVMLIAGQPSVSPHKGIVVTEIKRLTRDRVSSDRERLTLTKGALLLIAARPFAGHGIGSFESAFPPALARSGHLNPFTVTVTHPHNELLYVWSEGGIVALAGLLCWIALWAIPFRPLLNLLRRQRAPRHVVARGALTLPLMIHVMTEFPFYSSAVHGVLMVVLLWLALPIRARRSPRLFPSSPADTRLVQVMVICFCLAGMLFMGTALQSAFCIRAAEKTLLRDATPLTKVTNPLAQPERLQFDLAEENLLRFDTTHHAEWLNRFQQQAGLWLAIHNDAYLTDAMLRIAQVQQDKQQAAYWRQRGCLSFYTDPRFHCTPDVLDGLKESHDK